jgi:hypothetical protein
MHEQLGRSVSFSGAPRCCGDGGETGSSRAVRSRVLGAQMRKVSGHGAEP